MPIEGVPYLPPHYPPEEPVLDHEKEKYHKKDKKKRKKKKRKKKIKKSEPRYYSREQMLTLSPAFYFDPVTMIVFDLPQIQMKQARAIRAIAKYNEQSNLNSFAFFRRFQSWLYANYLDFFQDLDDIATQAHHFSTRTDICSSKSFIAENTYEARYLNEELNSITTGMGVMLNNFSHGHGQNKPKTRFEGPRFRN